MGTQIKTEVMNEEEMLRADPLNEEENWFDDKENKFTSDDLAYLPLNVKQEPLDEDEAMEEPIEPIEEPVEDNRMRIKDEPLDDFDDGLADYFLEDNPDPAELTEDFKFEEEYSKANLEDDDLGNGDVDAEVAKADDAEGVELKFQK